MELFLDDISHCLKVLEEGGLILYPTDTVWGIGCDATNEAAVAKIYALKQRVDTKKMIVLVASERNILHYVTSPDLEVFNYLASATKPTTVIYDGVIGMAENILGEDRSVAIRICGETFCKHLLKRFQKPIVSTSANISGQATPSFFPEIDKAIIDGVDYVVKYRQDDNTPRTPSAVVKWEKNGNLTVIRA
ncbi:L-threonylcarbamoyladenylate synthase [Parasediminibacterium sp. JCM 36343]|uniref:L-threonylcarbamoyladenylate synthase n=1 Tax=Parasediminibacterium sp. JCM 36343 TaxID=3374279 RepID=UPI00397D413C